LRGSQADFDRVKAKPFKTREAEYHVIDMEWPDAAFQLRGSQGDYERVKAKPYLEREKEY